MPTPAKTSAAVTTVLFDFGMVLSGPPDPAAWERMKSITGLSEQPLHEAYWHFRHDYDRAALTGTTYWQAVAARAGATITAAQIADLNVADVDMWTVPNAPMIAWVECLQQAGIPTGILSNIGDDIAYGIIARLPWLTRFKHCTWSHELFMAKPEHEIFLRTAAALQAEPSQILFIDDKPENTAAAAAVGMHVVTYGTHDAFEREMHIRGFGALLQSSADLQLA